jgi:hypothetical protein
VSLEDLNLEAILLSDFCMVWMPYFFSSLEMQSVVPWMYGWCAVWCPFSLMISLVGLALDVLLMSCRE